MDRGYFEAEDSGEVHRPLRERRYEYRSDEELYVYDQSCWNCALHHHSCPLEITEYDCKSRKQQKKDLEREDAVHKDGKIIWCVNWKQKRGRRR